MIAAAAVLAAGCGPDKKKDAAEMPETVPVPVVAVEAAVRQDVEQTETYSTTVQANVINNIAPQTAGRIQKLSVDVGDFVNAGQILAEMDNMQLVQAELRLKNSEIELRRVKSLLDEGGISQSDYESLELNYKVAKSSYDNLLENTVLRAPVSGVVTARNYDKGDMYSMSSPVFTVQQITPVKMLVAISETDYTKVNKGDKVTVTADAIPGKTFEGSIRRVYPVIDAATHTVSVEVVVRNGDRELRPGMFARATVDFGSNSSIVIPDSAVNKIQGSGQRTVFVLNPDNTVSSKFVTLGRHFGSRYEILSGLEEGDKVVYKGGSSLNSGDKVEVAR